MKGKFTLFLLLLCTCGNSVFSQNSAITLDGTSSSISTSSIIVPASGDFTVEFWAFVPSLASGLHEFVSQGSSGSGFYIGYDEGTGNIRAGDNWQNTGTAMPVARWTHIAVVKSGSDAVLYVDGVQKNSTTGYSIASTGSNFQIGRQFDPYSEYITGYIDQLRIWSIARAASDIRQGLFGSVPANSTGLIADYQMNEGSGTVLGNSTSNTGLDGTLTGTADWTYSPVQEGSNSVNFDGIDDQIIVAPSSIFDISTGTVEAWIYPTSLTAENSCIVANRGSGGTRFSFHVSATQIGLWNGDDFLPIDYAVPLNTWTHLAFVGKSSSATDVYVNGALVNTIAEGFGSGVGQTLNFGISKNAGADKEPFAGNIDEVRIWNTQLTQSEISNNMSSTLTGSETGLVALYSFNEGNAGNSNTGLITAIDNTSNGNNGTLTNFALTGSTSNWSNQSFTLPVSFTSFTATKVESTALLQWQTAQEENSREFVVERSLDGSSYTSIGSVAAAGNSQTPTSYSFTDASPLKGRNYYRLKEIDLDNRSIYSNIRIVVFGSLSDQKLSWYVTGSNSVQVTLSDGSNESFSVSDISGHILQKGQLVSGKVQLGQLPGGIYFVRVLSFTGQKLNTKVLIP